MERRTGARVRAGSPDRPNQLPINSRVQFCIFVHFRLPPPAHPASRSRAPAQRLYKTNISPVLNGRVVGKGRSLYPKGRRRRWFHRKPLRPFGYRLPERSRGAARGLLLYIIECLDKRRLEHRYQGRFKDRSAGTGRIDLGPAQCLRVGPQLGHGLIPSLIAWAKSQPPGNVAIVSVNYTESGRPFH